jgi:hypothetical protein
MEFYGSNIMNMLDRYLQAVRFFLPAKQQDDIVRELSENLISQMEDRAEELGRPLDEDEQATILRKHGHPIVVASRYRTHQRLIGPVIFPLYLIALKAGLGIALLVTVVLAAVTAALEGDAVRQAVEAMLAFPGRALMVFAWTTLGFAALDFAQSHMRLSTDWDPRKLPKLVRDEDRISRLRSLGELIVVLAALVWLLLLPRAPFLILGPAAALVEYGPAWRLVYVPILLLTLATGALHLIDFMRPYWSRPRALLRLAISGATLLIFAFLARTGQLFHAAPAVRIPDNVQVDQIVRIINASFQIGFAVAAFITAFEIAKALRRLKQRRGTPLSSGSTAACA